MNKKNKLMNYVLWLFAIFSYILKLSVTIF